MAHGSSLVVSRLAGEIVTALVTGGIGLAVAIGATEYGIAWTPAGPEPGAFPFGVGVLITAGSVVNLVQAVRRRNGDVFVDGTHLSRIASFFIPVCLFVALSVMVGLYVATAVYLAAVMIVQGRYNPLVSAGVGVGVALFFYVVLEVWFRVPLLKGPLEAWLGLH